MSKSTKKTKVTRVSQAKLPAAESLTNKPALPPTPPIAPVSSGPTQAQQPITSQAQPRPGKPQSVPVPKEQSASAPAGATPSRSPRLSESPTVERASEPAIQAKSKASSAQSAGTSASGTPKKNGIALEFYHPGASHVAVAGSFNGWKPDAAPLSSTGNGRWVGNVSVGPGRYEYLFVVDGQWQPDPNAKETVANPFGGQNSVLIVTG